MSARERKPGETWRCECGAALIGARTLAGKVAPIVVNASEAGNVLLCRVEGELISRTFAGETLAELRRQGVPLRLNHFADCPNAQRFQRR